VAVTICQHCILWPSTAIIALWASTHWEEIEALIAQWFERYMRVLPGFIFTPAEVVVNGWPWKTIIAVKLNVSWLRPDGEVYKNVALQMITLRWFKAVDIITIDDTSGFGALLNDLVNKFGVEEAGEKPIEGWF
jgi:hypothetical protein